VSSAGPQPARARPWLVPVGALRRRPGSRLDVEVTAPIDELAVSNSWVPEGAEVHFKGAVESAVGGVTVTGRVRAPYEGTCRRCLDTARGELDIAIRELCVDEPDPELGYGVGKDWLDLEPIVRDACILDLPLAPLCRDDCKGLCPECGANRNRESCSCATSADPRWAALASVSSEGQAEQDGSVEPGVGDDDGPRQRTE